MPVAGVLWEASPNRLAMSSDICAFGTKLLILEASSPASLVLGLPNRCTLEAVRTRLGMEPCVSLRPSPPVYVLTSVIETAVVARERRAPLVFAWVLCVAGVRDERGASSLGLGGNGGRSSRGLAEPSSSGTEISLRTPCSSSDMLLICLVSGVKSTLGYSMSKLAGTQLAQSTR